MKNFFTFLILLLFFSCSKTNTADQLKNANSSLSDVQQTLHRSTLESNIDIFDCPGVVTVTDTSNGQYTTSLECGSNSNFPNINTGKAPFGPKEGPPEPCKTLVIANSQLAQTAESIILRGIQNFNDSLLQVPEEGVTVTIWNRLGISEAEIKFLDNFFAAKTVSIINFTLDNSCVLMSEFIREEMTTLHAFATSLSPGINFFGKDWNGNGLMTTATSFISDPNSGFTGYWDTTTRSTTVQSNLQAQGIFPALPRFYFYFYIPQNDLNNYFTANPLPEGDEPVITPNP
ncbi:hypothetical protein ACTJIJ_06580 [Niabella sp. 22666]|uniref:hypothetical protein n=1 Tax=Niabella sp. 22666 TaxID=3453954 RepID=UPI003F871C27